MRGRGDRVSNPASIHLSAARFCWKWRVLVLPSDPCDSVESVCGSSGYQSVCGRLCVCSHLRDATSACVCMCVGVLKLDRRRGEKARDL